MNNTMFKLQFFKMNVILQEDPNFAELQEKNYKHMIKLNKIMFKYIQVLICSGNSFSLFLFPGNVLFRLF